MNTVPLGREGTGAAQILGPNRALQYALQQNQERQRRLERGQLEYERNQQGYANAFQRSMMETMNTVGGTRYVNPNIRNAIASATNEWARQGGQLMSQGINPFNPYQTDESREVAQQHNQSQAEIRSVLAINNQLVKEKEALVKRYTENEQSYDVDEFKSAIEWYDNLTPEDIMAGNITPPQVSEVYNIGLEAGKQFGAMYNDFSRYDVDDQGRQVYVEGREADVNRIMNIADSSVENPNTPYHKETNRRLRKAFGEGASIEVFSPFLGIYDKEEMERVVDAQLRNMPADENPLVDMLADGRNVNYGTEEYDKVVGDISDSLLEANSIVSGAKQEIIDAITGRTNTSEKVKLDYTEENQRMKRQAAASLERSRALSRQNTALSIQKKLSGEDDVADAMIDEAVDVDFSDEWDVDDPEVNPITAWGVIPQSPASVTINPSNTIDVKTGKTTKTGEMRGSISGFGLVALDANGNVVDGASPEALAKDARVVRFAPKVVVQDNKRRSHLYDVNAVPVSSLTKEKRENAQKAISVQQQTADRLNQQLKLRPATSNKTTQAWQNYNNGVTNLFSTPESETRNSVSTKKVIKW